ncbi:MAG: hypothetical protein JJT87_20030 [Halomonas sp.]|nr:hypothetical protein [Halomonas sp.]MCC5904207.1 hypothetical protein [Halomonas sp.]
MYNCFKSRLLPLSVAFAIALGLLLSLSACTTYTWPDGSQETVLGVVPEDDNQRYEERQAQGVRYRLPDDIPETH